MALKSIIIDYGIGNLASIKNMLKKIGVDSIITSNKEEIANAEKLILPGVGSFDYGMEALNSLGITEILQKKALENKTPILGICLGAQLMGNSSEEGKLPGLGLINMVVKKFDATQLPASYKIPHYGWNHIKIRKDSELFSGFDDDARFYFIHSYHFVQDNAEDILASTNYGYEFVSAFQRDNIMGVQFHPEKSHKYGLRLLENFTKMQ